MKAGDAAPVGRSIIAAPTDYVPFVIVSGARTGSTVLAQALNSSPEITCFREVFNFLLPGIIDYAVDGYDKTDKEDLALRTRDPIGFLQERIFCRHPDGIRAVGFKFHYQHFWGYPGLWQALVADTRLRIIHLRRRNLLRMLVSYEIAEKTGAWQKPAEPAITRATEKAGEAKQKLTPDNVLRALRNPARAIAWLRRPVPRPTLRPTAPREPVHISKDELRAFIKSTEASSSHFDELFREHKKITFWYEDLLQDSAQVFNRAQEFLEIEPKPLKVTLRRQNPEPLPELVRNHEELRSLFKGTPQAWMFE